VLTFTCTIMSTIIKPQAVRVDHNAASQPLADCFMGKQAATLPEAEKTKTTERSLALRQSS
jgi:hypothetical protein